MFFVSILYINFNFFNQNSKMSKKFKVIICRKNPKKTHIQCRNDNVTLKSRPKSQSVQGWSSRLSFSTNFL